MNVASSQIEETPADAPSRRGVARRIAFVIPHFPSQTHVFFWREMKSLGRFGVDVDVVSTTHPPSGEAVHEWTASAVSRTTYLDRPGIGLILGGVISLLRLGATFRCLSRLKKLATQEDGSRGSFMARTKRHVRNVGLMVMGAMVGQRARSRGWRHLHAHSCADAATLTSFAAVFAGLPWSMTLHGPIEHYGPGQAFKWNDAAFGIAVTERLRERVLRAAPDVDPARVLVAPMGVDLEIFDGPGEGTKDAAPAGAVTLVTCGRLHPAKGHQHAIDAVNILRKRGHDARLRILGGGGHESALRAQVANLGLDDVVELTGSVPETAVRDVLAESDIFVLGSHDEAIGVATMEAMAMGLPVVVTDVGGVRELIGDHEFGLLVPARDEVAMADAVESLIKDPARAHRVASQGLARVREHFSADRSARLIKASLA